MFGHERGAAVSGDRTPDKKHRLPLRIVYFPASCKGPEGGRG